MTTYRGVVARTGRLSRPAEPEDRTAVSADHVAGAPPGTATGRELGRIYRSRPRRDWNFTENLSSSSNASPYTRDTSDHRLIISASSLVMLMVGSIGFAAQAPVARTVGLVFYVLIGLGGAPWVLARSMRLPTRLAMTALTTLCVPTFVGTVMLQTRAWHPATAFVALAVVTVPLHVLGCRIAVRDRRSTRGRANPPGADRLVRLRRSLVRLARKHVNLSLLLSLGGGAICLVAALTHRHTDPGLWGFLPVIGPLWYAGLLLVLLSFAVSRASSDASVAIAVLILVLILTGTPALVYDGPRSQSASKHVDFVQQIRTVHQMNTTVAVYSAWPGYFAAMAWVSDIAGIRDPMRLAQAWPVLLGFFRLCALRFLAGTVLKSRTTAWVAVALAVLADPIGADYFSPQSVGFVLGLLIVAIALSHYDSRMKVVALTGAGCALATSHQLSPYIVGGTMCILAVFRQIRPWWLPATVLAPAVAWAASHWSALKEFVYFGEVGNAKNFRPPATATAPGLERLVVVDLTVWALVGGILILGATAAAVVYRRRRGIEVWALACAPISGLLVIAVNPYGQEGIFRATLFGLPWLALLAAQSFRSMSANRPNVALVAILAVLSTTFLVASFGMDAANVIRPTDRQAFHQFRSTPMPPGSVGYLLMLGPGDLPSSPPTEDLTHLSVERETVEPPGAVPPVETATARSRRLTKAIVAYSRRDGRPARIFALWSPTSSVYGWEYGLERPETFARLREALRTMPGWSVRYEAGGTVLFEYHQPRRRSAAPR
ncbi:hypothetical protein GCM10020358_65460 [Amorphoplanes nipponensis]|uniref:Uncharacterized protein n=1 Tax=Actinoplanes nipponensis TaxID=135950 RepID=A0A919JIH5_9ACTN|nr:hypothetical protein [Actinoplanes nipponensis]GIE51659.1 hypothetical protein Ani05nite_51930 [Actinoplanes nipponensis]